MPDAVFGMFLSATDVVLSVGMNVGCQIARMMSLRTASGN